MRLSPRPAETLVNQEAEELVVEPAEEDAMARKYSKGASKKVASAMRKRKKGTLKRGKGGKGGKGGKVKSRKQAIAIGLSEARKEGKKVPKRKSKTRKKK
jgi:hypothetical protein